MYINKVISYKNAWDTIKERYSSDILDIESGVDVIFRDSSDSSDSSRVREKNSRRDAWEFFMYERGWNGNQNGYYSPEGVRINLTLLGVIKNKISVAIPYSTFHSVSAWLFEKSTVAIKYNIIEIPIILYPIENFHRETKRIFLFDSFESILNQLSMLSPLSHQYPFLVFGYADTPPVNGVEVIELLSKENINNENLVIDRCIEFPPEYHQAGLGILNYFGTYLREQYPDENASVRIEQKGLHVRLIVETEDGKSEVIDKALHEYELIISGDEIPEKFAKSDKLILDLRNELRIANIRIESQRDLIEYQGGNINRLIEIIGSGLAQKNNFSVDFKPTISISNNVNINQFVSSALGGVSELIEKTHEGDEIHHALKELEKSLISIESDNEKSSVRRSPAMSRFTRFIDKVTEAGSSFNLAMKKLDKGWEVFSDLANRYNKLAEWCGLPKVPSVVLK